MRFLERKKVTSPTEIGSFSGLIYYLREDEGTQRFALAAAAALLDRMALRVGNPEYARDNGIDAAVQEPNKRKMNIRPGGYGENFATGRRGAWTH